MQSRLGKPARAGMLVVCAFFTALAGAQEKSEPAKTEKPAAEPFRRVSIGFRVGVSIEPLMNVYSATDTDTTLDPPQTTTIVGNSTSSRVAIGPTLQLNLTSKIGLNVDLLHRGVGYNVTTTVNNEATEDQDAAFVSALFETAQAKYWDVSFLPRYRFGKLGKPRPYLEAGMTLRKLSKLQGSQQTTDADQNVETTDSPTPPAHTAIRGAVLGAGIQFQDDVGVKVELEFRYTRWFQRNFDTTYAASRRSQGEVVVGLTF